MTRLRNLIALAFVFGATAAWADRPISGDMASTSDPATCQLEAWHERVASERAFVLGPACGIAPGLELGLTYASLTPRDVNRAEGGLSLKWVPAAWKVELGSTSLQFGLKTEGGWLQAADSPWRSSDTTVAGLLSWTLSDVWSVHLNAGMSRDRASSTRGTVGFAGVVWSPVQQVMIFADVQLNDRKAVFGGTVATAGARWWLVKDSLGLDLSAGRERGAGGPTRYSVGLGWYGIGS